MTVIQRKASFSSSPWRIYDPEGVEGSPEGPAAAAEPAATDAAEPAVADDSEAQGVAPAGPASTGFSVAQGVAKSQEGFETGPAQGVPWPSPSPTPSAADGPLSGKDAPIRDTIIVAGHSDYGDDSSDDSSYTPAVIVMPPKPLRESPAFSSALLGLSAISLFTEIKRAQQLTRTR
jgi:hypothetical protein